MSSSSIKLPPIGHDVLDGVGLAVPTTPSAQITGNGNTTWRVNLLAVEAVVDGVYKKIVAAADASIHASSYLTGFMVGYSCIATAIVRNVAGTISVIYVKGTPAPIGEAKPPSDATIQTAAGAHVPWLRLGNTRLDRTADTTLVQTVDNSVKAPSIHTYGPAEFQGMVNQLIQCAKSIREVHRNQFIGAGVVAPGSASTQASGTGNTTWRVGQSLIHTLVGGVFTEIAAITNFSIHASSYLTGFANGNSCVATLVISSALGVNSVTAIKGTPAVTGSQVAPTDAQIQAALGVGVPWVKLGSTTLNRTGDTTVTQSYDQSKRTMLAMTVDPGFAVF